MPNTATTGSPAVSESRQARCPPCGDRQRRQLVLHRRSDLRRRSREPAQHLIELVVIFGVHVSPSSKKPSTCTCPADPETSVTAWTAVVRHGAIKGLVRVQCECVSLPPVFVAHFEPSPVFCRSYAGAITYDQLRRIPCRRPNRIRLVADYLINAPRRSGDLRRVLARLKAFAHAQPGRVWRVLS